MKASPKKTCRCFVEVNKALEPKNMALLTPLMLASANQKKKFIVATIPIAGKRTPLQLQADYCPFCGIPLK